MTWITVDFAFTSYFSLRPSNTTTSGGKSLLVPTPFAIKLALLDRIIVNRGVDYAKTLFVAIRDLDIAIKGPQLITVTMPTESILRPEVNKWTNSIRRQEYCFYSDPVSLAFSTEERRLSNELPIWAAALSYLGKKGGFLQYLGHHTEADLPSKFINLCLPMAQDIPQIGILQYMDNMPTDVKFEDISRFSLSNKNEGNSRLHYQIIIPYRLQNRGILSTIYKKIDD